MRAVSIIGHGMTPVGEHWGTSLRQLGAEAGLKAIEHAGFPEINALYVANSYGATFSRQTQLGALLSDFMGLKLVEAITVEAGEASGGAALRQAYLAVASGAIEVALVVGVEKSTDTVGSQRILARNTSLDADYEAIHGATLPALAALLMRRYMHEFDIGLEAFEGFSINAHQNSKVNPNAMYRNTIKEGTFAYAPMVADPVNLFDSAPDGDGAAAVVLAASDVAEDIVAKPIQILGSGAATDSLMLQDREDILYLRAVGNSVVRALEQAQITRDDVNVFELHDAFTILSTLTLEAAGYAERGQGWSLGDAIHLGGRIPISTFGGLKGRGNPVGATGIYQAIEGCLQLQGEAGDNQVRDAEYVMIQNLGGLGSTAVTHILGKH